MEMLPLSKITFIDLYSLAVQPGVGVRASDALEVVGHIKYLLSSLLKMLLQSG